MQSRTMSMHINSKGEKQSCTPQSLGLIALRTLFATHTFSEFIKLCVTHPQLETYIGAPEIRSLWLSAPPISVAEAYCDCATGAIVEKYYPWSAGVIKHYNCVPGVGKMAKTISETAKLFVALSRARWFEITYHEPGRFVVRETLQPAFCTPMSQAYFSLTKSPKWLCKMSFPDVSNNFSNNFSNGSHVLIEHNIKKTHLQHVYLCKVGCGSAKELCGDAPDDCDFYIAGTSMDTDITRHVYIIKLKDGEYTIE